MHDHYSLFWIQRVAGGYLNSVIPPIAPTQIARIHTSLSRFLPNANQPPIMLIGSSHLFEPQEMTSVCGQSVASLQTPCHYGFSFYFDFVRLVCSLLNAEFAHYNASTRPSPLQHP
ncbi:hypothetical protein VNO78_12427 [Psophocarpus tetragonolobus]|uniref:Uncharacterized protein n=1 Tax=Psophocarpus tetragonolobus TaxID=3891 RepID=A0AAN9SVV0_PSOTE